jgi:hypothetical protein
VEVQKKANPLSRQLQISEQLGTVNRQKLIDSFQFKDNRIFHEQVHFVGTIQPYALIHNRQLNLAFEFETKLARFVAQALLISGLHKAGACLTMNLDGSADDLLG